MVKDLRLDPYEKKPWWVKQKWLWRNQFPLMLTYPVMLIISPLLCYIHHVRFHDPESKPYKYSRFKDHYVVLRDDDPQVKRVIKVDKADPMYTVKWW